MKTTQTVHCLFADVKLVVHYNLPKTLEGFYQESGRAGRDGKPACSVVFYGLDDRDRMDWILGKQQKGRGKKRKAGRAHALRAMHYPCMACLVAILNPVASHSVDFCIAKSSVCFSQACHMLLIILLEMFSVSVCLCSQFRHR